MTEWPTRQLGDICDPARGITYGIVKVGEFVANGVPVIRGGDIRDNRIAVDEKRRVSHDVSNQFDRTILCGGELVINLIAEPGHSAIVPHSMAGFNVSRDVAVIPLDDSVVHSYVNWYMKSTTAIEWLQARLSGSVTQKINLGVLRQLPIPIPTVPVQNAIAATLGALDDKIALDNRIAATADDLGEAKFEHCFNEGLRWVGDGATLSDGWRETTLGETTDVIEAGVRPKGGVAAYTEGVPSIGAESIVGLAQFDFSKVKYVPESFFATMRRGILQDYDILVYKDGGKPGDFKPHVTMFGGGFPFDRMCINEHVFRVRMKQPLDQTFGYYWLSSGPIMSEMRRRGTGAAIPGMNSVAVKGIPVVRPPGDLVARFSAAVSPLISRALQAAREARALSVLRDTLLPQLMSGKLRVRGAERVVEDAV
jgi:type I restriction enzyme S subunit